MKYRRFLLLFILSAAWKTLYADTLTGTITSPGGLPLDNDVTLELNLLLIPENGASSNIQLVEVISQNSVEHVYEFENLPDPVTVKHYLLSYECVAGCGDIVVKEYWTQFGPAYSNIAAERIQAEDVPNTEYDFELSLGSGLGGMLTLESGVADNDIDVNLIIVAEQVLEGGETPSPFTHQLTFTILTGQSQVPFEFRGLPIRDNMMYRIQIECAVNCEGLFTGLSFWGEPDSVTQFQQAATRPGDVFEFYDDVTVTLLNDGDGDGVPDLNDNCPEVSNQSQDDFDNDGLGDLCDLDTDGDGVEEIPMGIDPDGFNPFICGDGDMDGIDDCEVDCDYFTLTSQQQKTFVICL